MYYLYFINCCNNIIIKYRNWIKYYKPYIIIFIII